MEILLCIGSGESGEGEREGREEEEEGNRAEWKEGKKGRTGQDRAGRGITAEFFGAFMLDPAQHNKEEAKMIGKREAIKKNEEGEERKREKQCKSRIKGEKTGIEGFQSDPGTGRRRGAAPWRLSGGTPQPLPTRSVQPARMGVLNRR